MDHSGKGHDLGQGSTLSLRQSLNSLPTALLLALGEFSPGGRVGWSTPHDPRIQFFLLISGLTISGFQWTSFWGKLGRGRWMRWNYSLTVGAGLRATVATPVPSSVPILDSSYIQLASLPVLVVYVVAGLRPILPRNLSPDHNVVLSYTCPITMKNWAREFQKHFGGLPGNQMYSSLFLLCSSNPTSSLWSRAITPLRMVTLLVCWSLGTRSLKCPGGSYS